VVLEVPGVTPVENEGAGWLNKVYTIADIMALYSNATFRHVSPADNGLPADLCMPSLWLNLGDSADSGGAAYARAPIRRVTLNE
jgi:hypothetical protein